MVKNQIVATLRKPSVQLKFLLITLLFIPALIEQSENLTTFTNELR